MSTRRYPAVAAPSSAQPPAGSSARAGHAATPRSTITPAARRTVLVLQEPRVDVRAVDVDVAARAVAIARLDVALRRDRVALVAELGDLLADEQVPVHAPVGVVAARAPLRHEREVLEDERALELAVATEARPVV